MDPQTFRAAKDFRVGEGNRRHGVSRRIREPQLKLELET